MSDEARRLELLETATRAARANAANADPQMIGQAFPVGAVFLSVVDDDPADLLGYGTWARIAQGQFLVGQKTADADFDTAEETGGEKTHTLTLAEIPAHTHGQQVKNTANDGTAGARGGDTANDTTAGATVAAGGGGAHNNVPPYFVVYMWKRTA